MLAATHIDIPLLYFLLTTHLNINTLPHMFYV